jgi:hypothetical protein
LFLVAVAASILLTQGMPQAAPDPDRSLMSLSGDPTLPWEDPPSEPEEPWEKNAFNYILPAIEIAAFEVLLNQFDRHVIDSQAYGVNYDTLRANLHHAWVLDNDPFSTNMLQHPYSGAIFYGFARSAGLSYELSFLYTAYGSVLWEYAGETTPPSINDLIMTSVGGSFLGEALFRMANLLLRNGGNDPGVLRQVGAAVILPSATVDVYGNQYARIFQNQDPAVFLRMSLGGVRIVQDRNTSGDVGEWNALADFSLIYGLPGEPGYTYTRPFDYFAFEVSGGNRADSGIDNILVRGLLYGAPTEAGVDYRGIWGLYGTYDYISEDTFRIGTSALSLGTTGQCWLSRRVALQGTILGGVGFGAAGNKAPIGQRDYVYGIMPQALLSLRAIFSDVVMLEAIGRDYYVRGTGIDTQDATLNDARVEAAFSVRILGPIAITVRYAVSALESRYQTITPLNQMRGTLGFTISFLGDSGFGAVEWRNPEAP